MAPFPVRSQNVYLFTLRGGVASSNRVRNTPKMELLTSPCYLPVLGHLSSGTFAAVSCPGGVWGPR